MSNEISMEESEYLIANFKTISGNPLTDFLKDLSDVSDIQLPAQPPVIGDQIGNVRMLRSARKGIFVFAAQAILITSAVASTAALSGFGPAPIVNFARTSAHNLSVAINKVGKLITGNTPEILAGYKQETNPAAQTTPSQTQNADGLANLDFKKEATDDVSNLGSNSQVVEIAKEHSSSNETKIESGESQQSSKQQVSESSNETTSNSHQDTKSHEAGSSPEPIESKSPEPIESKSPEVIESTNPSEMKTPESNKGSMPAEVKSPEPIEAKTPASISTENPEVEK